MMNTMRNVSIEFISSFFSKHFILHLIFAILYNKNKLKSVLSEDFITGRTGKYKKSAITYLFINYFTDPSLSKRFANIFCIRPKEYVWFLLYRFGRIESVGDFYFYYFFCIFHFLFWLIRINI